MSDIEKKRRRTEFLLQLATMDYLLGNEWSGNRVIRKHAKPFPELIPFHVPNQGTDGTRGYFLMRMGVLAGVFDIPMFWPWAQCGFMELKAPGKDLRREQKTFDFSMGRIGHRTAVADAVYKVRDHIIGWGLECKNMACKEPNYATWEDQFNAWLEFVGNGEVVRLQ